MKVKTDHYDTAVIVGRFQVHELHSAHKSLIQQVCDEHDKVIVFLGLARNMNTKNNPLDFESRKQMIQAEFPNVIVGYIKDVDDDELWSRNLDSQISDLVSPTQSVVLYGSRGSFLELYHGKYPTVELEPESYVSGTDIRKMLARSVKASPDFRHGVAWAAANRFPTVFTTVDVAIFDAKYENILLGRKPDEKKFRLIGGFSDVRDKSFEGTAYREMTEETSMWHLDPKNSMTYLGSYEIDDWRYRNEVDKITTILYATVPIGGPKPGDDICELKWFNVNELAKENVVSSDEHGKAITVDGFKYTNQVVPQHHEIIARSLEYAINKQKDMDNDA